MCRIELPNTTRTSGFGQRKKVLGELQEREETTREEVLCKGGDCADCGNYRPLTMLSIPSKVVESVLCDTIDPHLNDVLHDNQWGYRKGISSESLLLYLTETWNHHIDQGKVIGAIFIDFRKAFDSVCPAILSHKLQACGISGNLFQWLNSYLSNRHQFVELNVVKSPVLEVKYGVPQGSLRGPRLFSIYVNDFPDCITQGELHLYADDTTAFVIVDNPDDVTIKLSCLFKEICAFCRLNKLTLHSVKSKVMIIQGDQFVGPLLPVTHGGTQIDYTMKTKLVGVVIDNKQTWRDQLEKTHKSLSSQYRVLKKMRYQLFCSVLWLSYMKLRTYILKLVDLSIEFLRIFWKVKY